MSRTSSEAAQLRPLARRATNHIEIHVDSAVLDLGELRQVTRTLQRPVQHGQPRFDHDARSNGRGRLIHARAEGSRFLTSATAGPSRNAEESGEATSHG